MRRQGGAAMAESAPRQPRTPVPPQNPIHHETTPSRHALTPHATQYSKPSAAATPTIQSPIQAPGVQDPTVAEVSKPEGARDHLQHEDHHLWTDMDACFKAFDKDDKNEVNPHHTPPLHDPTIGTDNSSPDLHSPDRTPINNLKSWTSANRVTIRDGFLSQNEFSALCRALFRNERGKPYPVDSTMLNTIFTIFDTNKNHVIDKEEFRFCWQKWIKQVVRPVTALLVVDVQNDFISGSLAISNCPAGQHGEEVIPPINHLLKDNRFDMVVYSLDWHPENHVSFIDNVHDRQLHETCKLTSDEAQVYDTVIFENENDCKPTEQKLWPRHCVQNTWGAELHQDLTIAEEAVLVYKGTDPDTDSYSAFWDNNKKAHTSLNEELQKRSVTDLFVCGIAYDVCVAATAKHAIEEGYRTMILDDACRGVSEKDIQATKDHTVANNGLVIHSSQVKSLASGRDRPPVLAYKLALELSKKGKK